MEREQTSGQALHDADAETRREAARAMGSARTEKKIAAARAVAESRKGSTWTEEQKANLRQKQQERRERERQEQAASAANMPVTVTEKKQAGRPRTRPMEEPAGEKRRPGRPPGTGKHQKAANEAGKENTV